MFRSLASATCALVLVSCQPDAGAPPDYSFHEDLVPDIDFILPVEPDPFQPGDERLAVGLFYEGERSITININGTTTNYFIFEESYSQALSSNRLEGLFSEEITLNGTPFWGGGIIWTEPIDLSDWTALNVAFNSSDPSFARFNLTLQSGLGAQPAGVDLDPTEYGYTNDGEWHFLQIPLQDAIDAGWDPTTARSPFIVGAPGGEEGDVLLIDNLYFTSD